MLRAVGLVVLPLVAVACMGSNDNSLLDDPEWNRKPGATDDDAREDDDDQGLPGPGGAGTPRPGDPNDPGGPGDPEDPIDPNNPPAELCDEVCGANARCLPSTRTCICLGGFVDSGSGCVAAPVGSPESHTEVEVCQQWNSGHQTTVAGSGWSSGGSQCSPGQLQREAINDAITRINMFRWFHGLGPVTDDEAGFDRAMACSTVGAFNPPGTVPDPHRPPAGATCYSDLGASGAGSSNMAWGSGSAAQAMDQWVQDRGSEDSLGHRRWIMNPRMGKTAIGFFGGGGPYSNASCMSSFDQSGSGPTPDFMTFPPAGFAPLQIMRWPWSVHMQSGNVNSGQLRVVRRSNGQELPFQRRTLQQGFAYPAIGFVPGNWQIVAGEVLDVTFTADGGVSRTWTVTAAGC